MMRTWERKQLKPRRRIGPLRWMASKTYNLGGQAMRNELILKCVFTQLRTPDLIKNCRLVSKQWNLVATEVLKRRSDAFIEVNSKTDFENLTACIQNSSDFPFREISVMCDRKDFGNFPEKWLKIWLFQQNLIIFTRLQLTVWRAPDTVISGLLLGPFNHIVSLTLNVIKRNKKSDEQRKKLFSWDQKNLLTFEKLTSIAMGKDVRCNQVDLSFLVALLQSCPNLGRIENITNAQLPAVFIAGKLGAVKKLSVCPCINKRKSCPRPTGVETLTIVESCFFGQEHEEPFVEFPHLQPLLDSSKDALRHIEVCCEVVDRDKSDDWPIMSKLKSLKLVQPFFFPDSVTKIFPALETVQLHGCRSTYNCVGDYMWKEPLTSVTELEAFVCLSQIDWRYLSQAIPAVRHIFLNYNFCKYHKHYQFLGDEKPEVTNHWGGVSRFKQLETLCISHLELPRINLDKFFTAIFHPVLKNLRRHPELPVLTSKFTKKVLRGSKSVADLSGLRELVIRFVMPNHGTEYDVLTKQPISHVTLQYGFKMAPADLKIYFLYDHWSMNARLIEQAFSPVSERVTFGHWNADLRAVRDTLYEDDDEEDEDDEDDDDEDDEDNAEDEDEDEDGEDSDDDDEDNAK